MACFPGIMAVWLCLIAAGLPAPISAHAETSSRSVSGDLSGTAYTGSTYLSLTREKLRRQLAADDLEPAVRTLQWILRIDPEDAVASVLAIELQLRHGNVAVAAMRLSDILDGSPAPDAAWAEAQRILAVLEAESTSGAVMVTRAMLDAATLTKVPGPLLIASVDDGFAYRVGKLPAGGDDMSRQIEGFAAATPLDEMRATMRTITRTGAQ